MKKKTIFLFAIICLLASLLSCESSIKKTEPNIEESSSDSSYDESLATQYGADDYGMRLYVMAFLKRGPNRSDDKEVADKLQAAHMANINKLAAEGKLVLAGPFGGDGDLRGIYIFDTSDVEEAKSWTATDPAIKAGSLEMELIQWYGSAAVMAIPELHEKVAKILM